jgi:hypothetical protein
MEKKIWGCPKKIISQKYFKASVGDFFYLSEAKVSITYT